MMVLLCFMVEDGSLALSEAKDIYGECMRFRKRVCRDHFHEAVDDEDDHLEVEEAREVTMCTEHAPTRDADNEESRGSACGAISGWIEKTKTHLWDCIERGTSGEDSLRHLDEDLGVIAHRKEVRESQPVRAALQLSSINLQNKNYVRFFRSLKKEATYLQCCICHHYLNTVFFNHDTFVQDPDAPVRPFRWIDDENATWSQVISTVENVIREVADEESLTICKDANVKGIAASISGSLVDEFISFSLFNGAFAVFSITLFFRDLLVDVVKEERQERDREREVSVRRFFEQLLDELIAERTRAAIKHELGEGIRAHNETTAHLLVDELWLAKLYFIGPPAISGTNGAVAVATFWDVLRDRVLENLRKRQERRHGWATFQDVWKCQSCVIRRLIYIVYMELVLITGHQ
ncbi:hypothetical protein TELCIR_10691 [Teladorsagia circumcincta]|uniref:SAC3/GANP/THP3 conserved domain-containing protein n=1 Tax=Teladorsagia circumcincta TaxID=45464 RepID=A0A2G9UCT9_TELCI|nr:hypothetical protein TELCIR_10691 [Teladorsagia circumcincta]